MHQLWLDFQTSFALSIQYRFNFFNNIGHYIERRNKLNVMNEYVITMRCSAVVLWNRSEKSNAYCFIHSTGWLIELITDDLNLDDELMLHSISYFNVLLFISTYELRQSLWSWGLGIDLLFELSRASTYQLQTIGRISKYRGKKVETGC